MKNERENYQAFFTWRLSSCFSLFSYPNPLILRREDKYFKMHFISRSEFGEENFDNGGEHIEDEGSFSLLFN